MTDTQTHTHTSINCLHKKHIATPRCASSFAITGASALHTYRVITRNLCIYFISLGRVFLVEMIVLQTMLFDIRAWSACFLLYSPICNIIKMQYKK